MTKRLLLSLTVITMALAAVAGATAAYFTDGVVLGSAETPNVFATGTVKIGEYKGFPLKLENLKPGETRTIEDVEINYSGTLAADIYMGVGGIADPNIPHDRLADFLYLKIYNAEDILVWKGYADELSKGWARLAKNVAENSSLTFDLKFTLDSNLGNEYQKLLNENTIIMIYAVQSGGPVPGPAEPWELILSNPGDWFEL